jgi:hypothetical protein
MADETPQDEPPRSQLDLIRTSKRNVYVPYEQRQELIRRLEAAGHGNAARELQERRAFTAAQKPHVFGVLNDWLDEVKIDAFGDHLMELRYELDDDLTAPGYSAQ